MASIEKEEIADVDGRVIKRRVLRADSIRITRPDGTKEELKDLPENFRAAEDPWTLADRPTLWELFNFPFGSFNLSQGLPHIITFLNEHPFMASLSNHRQLEQASFDKLRMARLYCGSELLLHDCWSRKMLNISWSARKSPKANTDIKDLMRR